MNKSIFFSIVILLAPVGAHGGNKADIKVMTQNQYLGATLTPIVTAGDPVSFNLAVINALQSIASNNLPERVQALAETIADKNPDLVGLQEVFSFGCIESGSLPGACFLFGAAFNNHLSETLDALADHGANYYVAATVQNLTIPSAGFPFPGLPVFPLRYIGTHRACTAVGNLGRRGRRTAQHSCLTGSAQDKAAA